MEPVIRTQALTKTYSNKKKNHSLPALNQLELEIQPGEIYGYLGPNGAGKTTSIKLILGFIFPDSGSISLLGKSSTDVSIRKQIGYMPEVANYYWFLKAGELLDAYGRMHHIEPPTRKKRIGELMERVGLLGKEKVFLKDFSKGMLQRFSLAQALLNEPQLLILDEPASGLDPVGRREIREIILELNRKGVSIFFSSHELSAVEMISTRVGILNKGKLVKEGSLNELLPSTRKMRVILQKPLSSEDITRLETKVHSLIPAAQSPIFTASIEQNDTILLVEDRDYIFALMRVLEEEKLPLEAITPLRETLEDIFMKSIREEN
jgi:ABC-2 type transport system ATP-binding protein